jgi:hypothetical protein
MQNNGTRPHIGWHQATDTGGRKQRPVGTGKFFPGIRGDEQVRWFRQRIDGTEGHREISQFEAHSP